ncbi:DUF2471 domain-containing protein [Mycetohabitans sp. B2]|uniref:DUF2471 family protein n=2 Tax=Burkholderiaceae TaxID=119060 RepID=A0ABZ2PW46_9BURK|nr:DUF2471 domain-containing protein [Mycetohabitans sp. B2]
MPGIAAPPGKRHLRQYLYKYTVYERKEIKMDDAFFSERAFDRAAADLRRIVHAIAGRYRVRGEPLTWRRLHDIEAEALSDLGLSCRHDASLLALFSPSLEHDFPHSDEVVCVSGAQRVPLITWFVFDVYDLVATPAPRPPQVQYKTAAMS